MIRKNIEIDRSMDWHDLLAGSITEAEDIARHLSVDPLPVKRVISRYPMRINLYYLSLIKQEGALLHQVIPDIREITDNKLTEDPLQEDRQSPVPNLIHRYPDRVLLMVSNQCPVYCRFCLRKRKVGQPFIVSRQSITQAIAYIKQNRMIREVILSGGDPLLLEDDALHSVLDRIRNIKHIDIIRIHTRVPGALPQRVTPALVEMLRRYHPVFINSHFNHPGEITSESSSACRLLADAGIPLGSQTVLLKGINDHPEIMKQLMRKLLTIRVKPYYLHHPDPVRGTAHFRTSIAHGMELLNQLRGHISGMCIPDYMIDLPQGGGKVPLLPRYKRKSTKSGFTFENYEGKIFDYPADE